MQAVCSTLEKKTKAINIIIPLSDAEKHPNIKGDLKCDFKTNKNLF